MVNAERAHVSSSFFLDQLQSYTVINIRGRKKRSAGPEPLSQLRINLLSGLPIVLWLGVQI